MTTAACGNVLLRRFCLHVIFWLKRFDDVGDINTTANGM